MKNYYYVLVLTLLVCISSTPVICMENFNGDNDPMENFPDTTNGDDFFDFDMNDLFLDPEEQEAIFRQIETESMLSTQNLNNNNNNTRGEIFPPYSTHELSDSSTIHNEISNPYFNSFFDNFQENTDPSSLNNLPNYTQQTDSFDPIEFYNQESSILTPSLVDRDQNTSSTKKTRKKQEDEYKKYQHNEYYYLESPSVKIKPVGITTNNSWEKQCKANPSPLTCHGCSDIFDSRQDYINHFFPEISGYNLINTQKLTGWCLGYATGKDKGFYCRICGNTINKNGGMTESKHINQVHITPFLCPDQECGFRCGHKKNFEKHLASCHPDLKFTIPYQEKKVFVTKLAKLSKPMPSPTIAKNNPPIIIDTQLAENNEPPIENFFNLLRQEPPQEKNIALDIEFTTDNLIAPNSPEDQPSILNQKVSASAIDNQVISKKIPNTNNTTPKEFKCRHQSCTFTSNRINRLEDHCKKEDHKGFLCPQKNCAYTSKYQSAINAHVKNNHSQHDASLLSEKPSKKRKRDSSNSENNKKLKPTADQLVGPIIAQKESNSTITQSDLEPLDSHETQNNFFIEQPAMPTSIDTQSSALNKAASTIAPTNNAITEHTPNTNSFIQPDQSITSNTPNQADSNLNKDSNSTTPLKVFKCAHQSCTFSTNKTEKLKQHWKETDHKRFLCSLEKWCGGFERHNIDTHIKHIHPELYDSLCLKKLPSDSNNSQISKEVETTTEQSVAPIVAQNKSNSTITQSHLEPSDSHETENNFDREQPSVPTPLDAQPSALNKTASNIVAINHTVREHTPKAPIQKFKCDHQSCTFITHRKKNLEAHCKELDHNGFLCPEENCDYTTKYQDKINTHIRNNKHKKTNTAPIKKFKCGYQSCTFTSNRISRIEDHCQDLNHNGFLCPQENCNYTSKYQSGINAHVNENHCEPDEKKKIRAPIEVITKLTNLLPCIDPNCSFKTYLFSKLKEHIQNYHTDSTKH